MTGIVKMRSIDVQCHAMEVRESNSTATLRRIFGGVYDNFDFTWFHANGPEGSLGGVAYTQEIDNRGSVQTLTFHCHHESSVKTDKGFDIHFKFIRLILTNKFGYKEWVYLINPVLRSTPRECSAEQIFCSAEFQHKSLAKILADIFQ